MAREKTNSDIPGDNTPQPNYMRLPAAQKDLVDRAIYGKIIHGNDFSAAELDRAKNGSSMDAFLHPNAAPSNHRPRTDQVEQEIEALREGYAGKLLKHDAATQSELKHLSAATPPAAESRRALNAIIKLGGDECGCQVNAQEISQPVINSIIRSAKSGQGR